MKKILKMQPIFFMGAFLFILVTTVSCNAVAVKKTALQADEKKEQPGKKDEYDSPDLAAEFEFMRTKDPALSIVPTNRLLIAKQLTKVLSETNARTMSGYGNWLERGPKSDVAGTYSNSRDAANIASTSARIRTILVDAADALEKTVFIAGIDGGIWKTTDITATPAIWIPLSDFLTNLAVTCIAQDPTDATILYASTGEAFSNIDAVSGVGVFKSTDHGDTWTLLSATTAYTSCTKIICDASGNVYLGTRGYGLLRCLKNGTTWTTITPSGIGTNICDLKISSTGRLHVVSGIFSTQLYRYTDAPATVSSSTFTAPVTAFPSYSNRAEIAVNGNTLYALPANNSYEVPTIYKSSDGGANWTATASQPGGGAWASGQGWYALAININPTNASECIIGGLDNYKTTNGGTSWTKISQWYGSSAAYVHADNHKITYLSGGTKMLISNDGGLFYSTDGGTTFVDKNNGLRIKQFYSVAAHPTNINYFLAGAQDNGSHQFSTAGLGNTVEVTGGDGAFVHIDQNQPLNQFTAYIYNQYYRSTNGGTSWTSVTLSTSSGQFINPTDYDNTAKIMYCGDAAGSYRRWTNPLTGSTSAVVAISALSSLSISAVTVSPFTANKVYFGTNGNSAKVCYVDNANTIISGSAGTSISTGLPSSGSVSCIAVGTADNNLMVSYSNYGVNSIWLSNNNGSTWTSIEGNLPDMPVRWCMFAPGSNTKAIIATETGVWFTTAINGASTIWKPSPGFPAVRTDMLAYRSMDGMVVAATHGRGLWTQTAASILPLNNFNVRGSRTTNKVELNWTYENLPGDAVMEVEGSIDATHYSKVASLYKALGDNYYFTDNTPLAAQNLYYRVKAMEKNGNIKYSNIVRLYIGNNATKGMIEIVNLYPNPVLNNIGIAFNVPEKGQAVYSIIATNGQTVWSKQALLSFVGNYNITENVEALKPGTYIFTITLNGKKSSKTFVKRSI